MDIKRHKRAVNENIEVTATYTDDIYRVNGNRDIDYLVNLENISCSCPDWRDRKPEGGCKHIIKAQIQKSKGEVPPEKSGWERENPQNSAKDTGENHRMERANPDSKKWSKLRKKALRRDNHECHVCKSSSGQGGSLHVHHIEPRSEGGEDLLDNLITLCHGCHEKLHGWPIPDPSSNTASGGHKSEKNSHKTSSQSVKASTRQESASSSGQRNRHPSSTATRRSNKQTSSPSTRTQSDGVVDADSTPDKLILHQIVHLFFEPALLGIVVNSLIVALVLEASIGYFEIDIPIGILSFCAVFAYQLFFVTQRPGSEFPRIFIILPALFGEIKRLLKSN